MKYQNLKNKMTKLGFKSRVLGFNKKIKSLFTLFVLFVLFVVSLIWSGEGILYSDFWLLNSLL